MPLQIIRQDITKMQVDAVVNTTNEEMVGYSGVDLAIHQAAGPELDAACKALAPLGLGTAKITPGFNMDVKYIIHTSGPVWRGGLRGEKIILKSCYLESLKQAVDYGCNTVAFPLISAGSYGYPKDQVLSYAVQVISEFLFEHELMVYLCVYDRTSYEFSRRLFAELEEAIGSDAADCDFMCAPHMLLEETDCCASAPVYPSANSPALRKQKRSAPKLFSRSQEKQSSVANKTLHEYMQSMEKTFAYKLFELIDERGMTDVECYKKANIDKKTFSKIKCNPDTYKPSKQTAVAFAIALQLNFDETQELLACAGLTLSRSFTFDKIIRYFIQKEIYDIFVINEALFEFDQVLLGC